MTAKEFKEHEWKVGEKIYQVIYKSFDFYEIPQKICTVYVDFIGPTQNVIGINLGGNKLDCIESRSSKSLRSFFFNKKDAIQYLEKEKKRFVEYNRNTVKRNLIHRRSQIFKDAYSELNKINGVLRMKIMNENE